MIKLCSLAALLHTIIVSTPVQSRDTVLQLLDAISQRDATTVQLLLNKDEFTAVERIIVREHAERIAQASEQQAIFSARTKKSILSTACVSLLMACGTVSIWQDPHAAEATNMYLSATWILACLAGSAITGIECETGRYTHTHIYIRDLVYQSFPTPPLEQINLIFYGISTRIDHIK